MSSFRKYPQRRMEEKSGSCVSRWCWNMTRSLPGYSFRKSRISADIMTKKPQSKNLYSPDFHWECMFLWNFCNWWISILCGISGSGSLRDQWRVWIKFWVSMKTLIKVVISCMPFIPCFLLNTVHRDNFTPILFVPLLPYWSVDWWI